MLDLLDYALLNAGNSKYSVNFCVQSNTKLTQCAAIIIMKMTDKPESSLHNMQYYGTGNSKFSVNLV